MRRGCGIKAGSLCSHCVRVRRDPLKSPVARTCAASTQLLSGEVMT